MIHKRSKSAATEVQSTIDKLCNLSVEEKEIEDLLFKSHELLKQLSVQLQIIGSKEGLDKEDVNGYYKKACLKFPKIFREFTKHVLGKDEWEKRRYLERKARKA